MGLSVRLSVTFVLGQELLEIGKLENPCPLDLSLQSYYPFQFIFHFYYMKLVNKISQEPLEPGSWIVSKLVKFARSMTELSPFPVF